MEMTTGPMFTLYVVWHPSYREGQQIADLLRTHFGRNRYRGVGEERAVSVLEHSQPVPGALTPFLLFFVCSRAWTAAVPTVP